MAQSTRFNSCNYQIEFYSGGVTFWQNLLYNNMVYQLDASKVPVRIHETGKKYILLSELISNQYDKESKRFGFRKIIPDTIYLPQSKIVIRKVPVKISVFNSNSLSMAEIIPPPNTIYISVKGESSILTQLDTIKLRIKTNTTAEKRKLLNIKLPAKSSKGFVFQDKQITNYQVNYIRFISKVITLKINEPTKRVQLVPDVVKLDFLVRMEDFDNVSSADFLVKPIIKPDYNKALLIVDKAPKFVKNIRLRPNEVDYIKIK